MKFPTRRWGRARGSVISLVCAALVCFIAGACTADSSHIYRADGIANLRNVTRVINTHAKAGEFEYCRNWRLSNDQIVAFFTLATAITAEEKTMAYDWSPCSIDGMFDTPYNKNARFSINAASFAEVRFEDGEVSYFGCKNKCAAIFDFGFY